jgi:hypothetical protein
LASGEVFKYIYTCIYSILSVYELFCYSVSKHPKKHNHTSDILTKNLKYPEAMELAQI